jgi:formate dehydrogenase
MAKILCVLYDDPIDGYPTKYPRDDLPRLDRYPDGQTLPTPSAIDFQPGALLGSVSGELGLRKFLEAGGHQLVVTEDKDGPDSEFERELGVTFHESAADMVPHCDVVTINAPLHPETENLFDAAMIARMKRGAYLVNTARGKIANRDAVAEALESGHLAGYAGDVWFPQPAPRDHPWRTMPNHGMTPHISGSSLSAQARYAAGTREILECFLEGRPIREEYLIVDGGKLAGAGAHSYSEGNATGGSEEAARFKAAPPPIPAQ